MSDIFKVKSNNQWIGLNAMVGPQGPAGQDGRDGADGHDGVDGTSAGFGTPTASASALQPGASPTVSVTASGPDTAKVFNFSFGIPNSGVVQADWNESDTSASDYIKNKPTIPSAQVNSDWNSSSGVSEILNKPDLTLKEDVSNKVTSLSLSSTDTEYPSAKCVFDAIQTGGGGGAAFVEDTTVYTVNSNPITLSTNNYLKGVTYIYHFYISDGGSSGTKTYFDIASPDTSLWKVDMSSYTYSSQQGYSPSTSSIRVISRKTGTNLHYDTSYVSSYGSSPLYFTFFVTRVS